MSPAQHSTDARPNPIRVLLVQMTGIVADLVRRLVSQQSDLEIVASVPDIRELQGAAGLTEVDLVITAYPQGESDLKLLDPFLAARPGLRVLAIEGEGRTASMYSLVTQTTQLGTLTPETLIEFIRAPWSMP